MTEQHESDADFVEWFDGLCEQPGKLSEMRHVPKGHAVTPAPAEDVERVVAEAIAKELGEAVHSHSPGMLRVARAAIAAIPHGAERQRGLLEAAEIADANGHNCLKSRDLSVAVSDMRDCTKWSQKAQTAFDIAGAIRERAAAAQHGEAGQKRGIYIASKTKHAYLWRRMRDTSEFPVVSTWIDEAGPGESADLTDLWRRCIGEAAGAAVLVVYREPEDVLKGAWAEVGAALASGTPVLAVGIEGEFSIAHAPGVRHFAKMCDAMEEANVIARRRPLAPARGGEP